MASADLAITLSVRMGNLEAGLNKTNAALRTMQRQSRETGRAVANIGQSFSAMEAPATAAFGAIRTSILGVIGVVTGGGLVAGITAAVTRVNALADAAAQVGVSVEALQAVQIAFEEAGSSAQVAEQGLGRLGTLIGDAARGSKEAQETFVKLGVSFRNVDGSARTTTQVFDQLRERIASATSEQEKLSIAAEVFGTRGARAAVAAMEEIGGSVDSATARYREMGLVVSTETASRLDVLGTAFANLGRAIATNLADAIASVQPTITEFLNWLTQQVNVASGIIRGLAVQSQTYSDRTWQEMSNRAAQAQQAARDAQRRLEALEREQPARSVFSLGRTQEAIDRDLLAARERVRVTQQEADATRAVANQRLEVNRLMANLPATPAIPVAPGPAAAPPRVTAGGGRSGGGSTRETEEQREANRLLRESYRDLMKIQEAAVDPQTRMVASLGEVTTALREQDRAFQAYTAAYGRAPAGIEPVRLSLAALTTQAETAAERMMRSAEALGEPSEQIMERIATAVRAYAEELARAGRITTDQIDGMVAAAQNAANRVQSTGFMAGFRSGAGVDLTKAAPDFMTEIGRGFGQISTQVFDDLAASLDKVASGAMTAGEAMSRFALDFVKAVAMMIAKAAALAAIQFLIRSISGTPSVGGAPKDFGGFRAAGGPVSVGRSYIVGERGPELFVPSGSGRIVPSGGSAPVVNIVNNAPGVVVTQGPSTDKVIAIAVDLSRKRVAQDFGESARTGYGAYAEPLTARYAMRRRV